MKTPIRKMSGLGDSEVKAENGKLLITFRGLTSKNNPIAFQIPMDFWFWSYLVGQVAKAWIIERKNRMNEIDSVNQSFNPSDINKQP